MNLTLLFITLTILALTCDISYVTTSCNCSYQHVSLFNVFVDKFGKLDNDYWIGVFNSKCIIKPIILNDVLHMNAMKKDLVLVKSRYLFII